jgi:hypothetical protein
MRRVPSLSRLPTLIAIESGREHNSDGASALNNTEREGPSLNAAYGVIALNAFTWIWIFYQTFSFGMPGRAPTILVAVPIAGVSLMVGLPLIVLRVRKPRLAFVAASASLGVFVVFVIAAFKSSGI